MHRLLPHIFRSDIPQNMNRSLNVERIALCLRSLLINRRRASYPIRASMLSLHLCDQDFSQHANIPQLSPGPRQRNHIPRTKPPHRPDHTPTAERNNTHPREQPAIANRGDKRLRRHRAHSGEDIADEVIGRDAGGGAAGHELCEHCGGHGEDEHGADAEEEVGDQLRAFS